MDLTRLAIDNDRVSLVLLLALLVAGISAFFNLPRDEDPGFTIRVAQVVTHFPGASPARVEQLVTDKIERVVQQMPELDFVTSESAAGISIVRINLKEEYRDLRPIWDDLRRKIDSVRAELPGDVHGPVVNDEFGEVFGVVLTVKGDGFDYAELKQVADEVRDELLRLEEVAKVEIHGDQAERVFVEYDNARLAELGLSPAELAQVLSTSNIIVSGGAVTVGRERILLEPSGNFESVDDLKRTVIALPAGGETLFLADIAQVYRGYIDPPESAVRADGQPSLALAVSMVKGGNIIRLGEQVSAALDDIGNAYPWGIELQLVAYQPGRVEESVSGFVTNLMQSVLVVIGVMLMFLGLRTGLVVASLIPMAVLLTFVVMSMFGIGLDRMSLAALIIALGMLVDNAIVMVENIQVLSAQGVSRRDAAMQSARELRVPLLTSSMTTAAAFLPIFLAESTVGEYTAPLFKVLTIALLSSWVLSLTMVPLLCTRLLPVGQNPIAEKEDGSGGAGARYQRLLDSVLRRRWLFIVTLLLLLFSAIGIARLVPNIFFPASENRFFKADLELPVGTDIEQTRATVKQLEVFIESRLLATPERAGIVDWVAYIGSGGPRYVLGHTPKPPKPHYAYLLINVSDEQVIDQLIEQLENYSRDQFPDLTATFRRTLNGPPVEKPVQVRLIGRDDEQLFAYADQVKGYLRAVPGTVNITDDWGMRTKKLRVKINQARARRASVSNQDIALALQTGLSGLVSTDFREGEELIPVVLRSDAAERQDLSKLAAINVFSSSSGRAVPLRQVADIEVDWQPAQILRRDRSRVVTVSADLQSDVNAAAITAEMIPWLEQRSADWPIGYRWELGGEYETSGKAQSSIRAKLPVASLVIALLLVMQFNSVRKVAIILLTIPLGIIGVMPGLYLSGANLGFMTFLGIISLSGIIINNAIVLIDRIGLEMSENGLSAAAAISAAGARRLRPILLTTATTVLGMVPLWIGGGALFQSMAIAIIAGLLFATVLTLGLVPVLYSLLFRVNNRAI